MALVKTIQGSGNAGQTAQAIVGFVTKAQTATAAAQGGQTLPTSVVEYSSSTANYGPTLPSDSAPGDKYWIANTSANTIKVWPASGFKINGGSADAALSIATLKSAVFISLGDGNWFAILTA
ncbi:MAG: hypothetical protein WCL21_18510 [Mariniphaga sp.]